MWDYDAQETPALIDVTWQNRPRKLLVQANRNGFFYVLDRTDGKFLLGKQYAKNVTWASGLTPEGRPDDGAQHGADARGQTRVPVARRFVELVLDVVQSGHGAVLRADQRQVRRLHAGRRWNGKPERASWAARSSRRRTSRHSAILRAIDIQTGRIVWELPQTGAVDSWGGALSTAGGVVIFGEDSGSLMAADATTGKPLWSFQTSQLWKASPMTYMFDNKQYIAVADGFEHHRVWVGG